jgi:hypothetical protein
MPSDHRYYDPMRELDLLLLEDFMMRSNVQPTRPAVALQKTCMLLVVLGVGAIFVYALMPDAGTTATLQPKDPAARLH